MKQPVSKNFVTPDALALRQALGEFATGVTVVTARDASGRPVGITVNSFASVSLDPPLVLWSLGRQSPLHEVFGNCTHWAVNVLAADQQALSERFSQADTDRFAGLEWKVGAGDTPLLAGCSAWFECRSEAHHPGGDHLILVGRVENFRRETKAPLIFHGGRYRELA
jgi:flavin reductase (DIM6/NTAB) family NADH-FMN oxidoreductase RutF